MMFGRLQEPVGRWTSRALRLHPSDPSSIAGIPSQRNSFDGKGYGFLPNGLESTRSGSIPQACGWEGGLSARTDDPPDLSDWPAGRSDSADLPISPSAKMFF